MINVQILTKLLILWKQSHIKDTQEMLESAFELVSDVGTDKRINDLDFDVSGSGIEVKIIKLIHFILIYTSVFTNLNLKYNP